MQIIRDTGTLRKAVGEVRATGRVALVPTMGALHAGHMALVSEAARRTDHVVVSIFVNALQFGAGEDLATYPRREAEDARLLEEAGCEILWAPDAAVMYPPGFATTVSVAGVSEGLCGTIRPGHFDGVATVVAKLFGQVRPDVAVFGEKDFQQLAVIRRMAADLDLGVEIVGVPTVRESDGLALSSRNAYLSPEERRTALALPATLTAAARRLAAGESVPEILDEARRRLEAAGFAVDYVEFRDEETLDPVVRPRRPARLLAAARIGRTRLIDNLPVAPSRS